ncbi:hypothetical protein VNO77_30967 [Canavalia gladiata]|uniref:Uncharacterized protein n=1 Tax=Canavalia gladiata TaxID=3824 RepID=A0AAN9KS27_CANGL
MCSMEDSNPGTVGQQRPSQPLGQAPCELFILLMWANLMPLLGLSCHWEYCNLNLLGCKRDSYDVNELEDDWASLFIMQNRSLSRSSDQVQLSGLGKPIPLETTQGNQHPQKDSINAASRSGQGRFPLFNGRFPWSVRPESESSQEDMVPEAFNCISLCVGTSERISRILL